MQQTGRAEDHDSNAASAGEGAGATEAAGVVMTESGKRWVVLASLILEHVRVEGEPALQWLERACRATDD